MEGLIIKAISSFYYVSSEDTVYECKARGILRNNNISPVVGDRVVFSPLSDDKGVIEEVKTRKNLLKRPTVANIDKLIIVSSPKTPAPDTLMIDRLIALAVKYDITPVIVFNKCDMGDMKEFADIYKSVGFDTFVVSAKEGTGVSLLKASLKGFVCAFAGNSGVGKSSLINKMFGSINAKVGEVSLKLGRGKHTTRHTELFKIDDFYIVDTPGFAAFRFSDEFSVPLSLCQVYPDFKDYINTCRFSTCSHTCEPFCSLIDAVQNGKVNKNRYDNYIVLYNEIKESHKGER